MVVGVGVNVGGIVCWMVIEVSLARQKMLRGGRGVACLLYIGGAGLFESCPEWCFLSRWRRPFRVA